MKKLFTLFLIVVLPVCCLKAQEWNISSEVFNALGTLNTTTTVNGLTIHASSEKTVAVDANNKTLDEMAFTHRLKLGGSGEFDENGLPLARVLAFEIAGDAVITVAGMSSSSSENRELHVAVNHKDSILGTFQALGTEISKGVYTYSGGQATIYLYSPSSGVNVYYLNVQATEVPNTVVREWNISSNDFNALGVMDTVTTVNELTVWAHSGKTVEVDANNKSLGDMQFTHRLKLGGSGEFDDAGLAAGRVVSFDVEGDASITVAAMSSSSSENRQLHIAVNHGDSILATFPAMGAELTQATYEYTGGPATIYLYSPSSGVNIYYLKVEETITAPADENIWNISLEDFNSLGTMTENTTVNGLKIWASTEKTVVVDENNKSLDGMDFTHRLKLGGQGDFDEAGLPRGRVVSFEVQGNTKITVMAMSSSSSENRELQLAVNHKDSVLGTFNALGTELTKGEFVYEGGPATIFLYSSHSGINIYYLEAEETVTSIKPVNNAPLEVKVYPNPATEKVFVNAPGPMMVAIYNLSGVMVKSKWIETKHDFIQVNDLLPGMYIIRSQESKAFSQKIVIR